MREIHRSPETRSDVFFDLPLNKRLSKQSRRRWFETSWRSLWRHCYDFVFWMFVVGIMFVLETKRAKIFQRKNKLAPTYEMEMLQVIKNPFIQKYIIQIWKIRVFLHENQYQSRPYFQLSKLCKFVTYFHQTNCKKGIQFSQDSNYQLINSSWNRPIHVIIWLMTFAPVLLQMWLMVVNSLVSRRYFSYINVLLWCFDVCKTMYTRGPFYPFMDN